MADKLDFVNRKNNNGEEDSDIESEGYSSDATSTNSNDSDHISLDSEVNIDLVKLDTCELDEILEIIEKAHNLNKIAGKELFSVYPILDEGYSFIIKNNKTNLLEEIPYEHSTQDLLNLFKDLAKNTQSENNLSDSLETLTQEKFDKSFKMDKLNNKINDPEKNLFSGAKAQVATSLPPPPKVLPKIGTILDGTWAQGAPGGGATQLNLEV